MAGNDAASVDSTAATDGESPDRQVERVTLESLQATPHEVLFDGPPKTVRLSLEQGESVPEHDHPETTVILHLLSGELTLTLDGIEHGVEAGEVLRFSGDQQIAPTAESAATALIVLAKTPAR